MHRLLATVPGLMFSISYTTRAPRGHETNGEDYHFISREEFEARLDARRIPGICRGFRQLLRHPPRALRTRRPRGQGPGTRHRRARCATIEGSDSGSGDYLCASSVPRDPGAAAARAVEDSEAVIERRLQDAAEEIRNYTQYDYVLINREIEESAERLASIVRAERVRRPGWKKKSGRFWKLSSSKY